MQINSVHSTVWVRSAVVAVGHGGAMTGAAVAAVNDVTGSTGSASPTAIENRQPYLALTQAIRVSGPAATLGSSQTFASGIIPDGYLPADGRLLGVTTNQALFSVLSSTYGGNGLNTFALPDLRGRTAVGAGGALGNAGAIGGTNTNTLTTATLPIHAHQLPSGVVSNTGFTDVAGGSQEYGNTQPSLAMNYRVSTQGNFPLSQGAAINNPFVGDVTLTANTAATPNLLGRTAIGSEGGAAGPGLTPRVLGTTPGSLTTALLQSQLPAHSHSISPVYAGPNQSTSSVGQSLPVDNVQSSLALNYIISLQGIIPSTTGSGDPDNQPFLGEVRLFAGSYAPSGYAFCSGQILSAAEYSALFDLIGNLYGGNGTTNFALPDLRGRIVIGTNGATIPLGTNGGVESYTLSQANLPAHSHSFTAVPEPAALGLCGAAAIAGLRRRRRPTI